MLKPGFGVEVEMTDTNDCLARISIELSGPTISQFHKKGIALVRRFNIPVHFWDAHYELILLGNVEDLITYSAGVDP